MLLDVSSALRNLGESFPFIHEEKIAPQLILGETIEFDEPVLLKGSMKASQAVVYLSGELEAVVRAHCSRCLEPMSFKLSVPFNERFIKQGDRAGSENRAKAEDLDEFEEVQAFQGYQIDLSELALSLAVLELPMNFLCREDCEGLSYEQEAENKVNACQEAYIEHPFAALQKMLTKDQEV